MPEGVAGVPEEVAVVPEDGSKNHKVLPSQQS